jgi:Patatin-like phospholipase
VANVGSAVSRVTARTDLIASIFPRTGFALSGGGAKGSFEVGALKYLMRAAGVHPDVITCTSVGAVNGMKLAEGEGGPIQVNGRSQARGLEGLEQLWLAFRSPSEMYAPSAALSKLSLDYYSAIPLLMGQVGQQVMGMAVPLIAAGVSLLTFLGPLGLPFLPFLDTGQLETEIDQLQAVVDGSSFFSLKPLADIYDRGNPDKHLVVGSKIELIFATVGLTSGELRYVRLVGIDHQGRLIGDLVGRDQVSSHLPTPATVRNPVDMKTGMLASAAAPFMFEPQQLTADRELYTDGGVRELVPVQAAIDRGARRVFAIDCNAPYPAAGSQAPHETQPPDGLLGIGLDVLAILLDEIGLNDVVMPSPDVAWVWHVRPRFEAEGDMEIDAGAIPVNIGYGYMCAFDAVDGSARTLPRRAVLQSIGERIAMQRRDIADRERCLRWVVETWAIRDKNQVPNFPRAWKRKVVMTAAGIPWTTADETDLPPDDDTLKRALVQLLDYHRFVDKSDHDVASRVANLTADVDVAAGYFPRGFGVSEDAHYLDDIISDTPPNRTDHATALSTLQSMKCELQPLYQARLDLAGPRCVPASRDDPSTTDQPWLHWERFDSEVFYGNLWPDGPSCTATLDQKTQVSVASAQVESKGTSGWAVQSGAASGSFPDRVQLLFPHGETLVHVSGSFAPTGSTITPWLAPSGTKWTTAWETNPASPVQLGATATSVTCCPLPDTAFASLAALVRLQGANDAGDSLLELSYDGVSRTWTVLGPVAVAGAPITSVTGNPVLFQSTFAQQESLELLVPTGDHITHLCRDLPSGAWNQRSDGIDLADPTASSSGPMAPTPVSPRAIACFQGNYGAPANLEAVVAVEDVVTSTVTSLQAYYFDAWAQVWKHIGPVQTADGPIDGISGDPVMFQSKAGARGDFELLVPAGDVVHHLYRDNDAAMAWKRRGNGIAYAGGTPGGHGGPLVISATPVAIAAYQSIDGVIGSPNLEAIIRIHPPLVQQGPGEFFEAHWFDPATQTWHSAGQVTIQGAPLQV